MLATLDVRGRSEQQLVFPACSMYGHVCGHLCKFQTVSYPHTQQRSYQLLSLP